MFIRVFVLLIVGFTLSGCASVDNTVWLPESISKTSTSAYGTVFGSIGIGENNRLITSRSLHYRAVGQKGMSVTAGGYFLVANKLHRDLAILSGRGEKIASDKVTIVVPTFLLIGVPVFRDSRAE